MGTQATQLTPREILDVLTDDEKLQACAKFWCCLEAAGAHKELIAALERLPRFTPGYLRRASPAARARILCAQLRAPKLRPFLPTVLNTLIGSDACPVAPHHLYDAVGLDPTKNYGGSGHRAIDTDLIVAGVRTLLTKYPRRPVFILLAVVISDEYQIWQGLPLALERLGIDLCASLRTSKDMTPEAPASALQEQVHSLTQELTVAKKAAAMFEQQLKETLGRHLAETEGWHKKLRVCKEECDATIEKRVKDELSGVIRPWLAEAQITEKHITQDDHWFSDVCKEASQALAQQKVYDRHNGNRATLENWLQTAQDYRRHLQDAVANGLNVRPATKEALREIEGAIARIQRWLHHSPTVDPHYQRLESAINAALDLKSLKELEALVGGNCRALVITYEQKAQLDDHIHRVFSRLRDKLNAPADRNVTPNGWDLREAIIKAQPTVLMVDCYNVLFAFQWRLSEVFEQGIPRAEAREVLVTWLKKLVIDRPYLQVRAVFDSPKASVTNVLSNLVLEYSGGEGKHRADNCIVDWLSKNQASLRTQKAFVVTDDQSLREQCCKLDAVYCPNGVCGALLEHFGCVDT